MTHPLSHIARFAFSLGVASSVAASVAPPADDGGSYRAHLAATWASHRLGEAADARTWLDRAPASERGWEWRWLDGMLDRSLSTGDALPATPHQLALHPDGRRIAIACANGSVLLREPVQESDATLLANHPGGAYSVAFTADGARAVTSGSDRIAAIVRVADGTTIREFLEHRFPVSAAVFSKDGSRVASASYHVDKETPIRGRVHLWSAETGQIEATYEGGVKPLSSVALSPDESWLAAGSWDSCVFVWKVADRGAVKPLRLECPRGGNQNVHINEIAWSPDGTHLAAATDQEVALVFRAADGTLVATLSDHHAETAAIAFAPDGRTLATGGADGAIRLWNTSDWSARSVLRGHRAPVVTLAWRPDGRTLISAGADRTIRTWDGARTDHEGVRGRFDETNYSVAFTPDGKHLACAASSRACGLMDSVTGEVTSRWSVEATRELCTAAVSPDGKRFGVCSWDATIRILDRTSGAVLTTLTAPAGAAYVVWHPSGERVAAALQDGTAVVLDVATGKVLVTLEGHTSRVNSVAYSPDGLRLVTASTDRTARLWTADDGKAIAILTGHELAIESAVFTPDGAHVVSAGHDGQVRLWPATPGESPRVGALVHALGKPLYRVDVSPDGRRIAAGGDQLLILEPRQDGLLLKCKPLAASIWHLDWSPDGERLALGSWDGQVLILGTPR